MLKITIGTISGTPIKEYFLDSLQHEVEHLYQQFKTNQTLPLDKNNYNIAYYSLNNANDDIRLIGETIYYSSPFEQDGYVNGLYKFIQEQNTPIDYNDIINAPTILGYKKLKENVKQLYNNQDSRENIETLLKRYYKNISYDKLMSIGTEGLKRFIIIIGKVMSKHNKEMINKGWRK